MHFWTKIDNSLSDIVELLSGVVQGSGIGPLMFYCTLMNRLIYMKAMVSELKFLLTILKLISEL